VSEWFKVPSC